LTTGYGGKEGERGGQQNQKIKASNSGTGKKVTQSDNQRSRVTNTEQGEKKTDEKPPGRLKSNRTIQDTTRKKRRGKNRTRDLLTVGNKTAGPKEQTKSGGTTGKRHKKKKGKKGKERVDHTAKRKNQRKGRMGSLQKKKKRTEGGELGGGKNLVSVG